MTGLITFPSEGYYRIPATYGITYTTADRTSFTPVSALARFESDYTDKTISGDRTIVPTAANGVFGTSQPVSADLTDDFFVAFFDAVETTGGATQRAFIERYWTDDTNLESCTDSDPDYAATVVTLNTIIPGVSIADEPPPATTTTTTSTPLSTTTSASQVIAPAFAG